MKIRTDDYAQLQRLWRDRTHGAEGAVLDGAGALAVYKAGWGDVDAGAIGVKERALIDALVRLYGGGMLVRAYDHPNR